MEHPRSDSNFTMSVDVFLLINLPALMHRNAVLPARLPRPGRVPRTSCVIPELPKVPNPAYQSSTRASQVPTDPDSIRVPSSVLTAPLGLLCPAVVSKGDFSIRDQPQPPKSRASILGSNWRCAQVRCMAGSMSMDNSALF